MNDLAQKLHALNACAFLRLAHSLGTGLRKPREKAGDLLSIGSTFGEEGNEVNQQPGMSTRKRRAREKAVVKIQSAARRFLHRGNLENQRKWREEKDFESKEEKCILIQSYVRRFLAQLTRKKYNQKEHNCIIIQCYVRRFLAQLKREKAKWTREYEWQKLYALYEPYKEIYQEHAARVQQEKEALQKEIDEIELKLNGVTKDTETEIEKMQAANELQKKVWGDVIQKRIEKELAAKQDAQEAEEYVGDEAIEGTEEEFEEDNRQMKLWIEKTQEKIDKKRAEGETLQQTNADVESMFFELNEFAKKKVAEKKDLSAQKLMLTNMMLPKAQKQLKTAAEEAAIEYRSKVVHRKYMYKILHALQSSNVDDHDAYEAVLKSVEECETELSMDVLASDEVHELLVCDINLLLERDAPPEVAHVNPVTDVESKWGALTSTLLSKAGKKTPFGIF